MVGITIFSTLASLFGEIYWNIAPTVALKLMSVATTRNPHVFHDYSIRPLFIYGFDTAAIDLISLFQAALAVFAVICAKWILLGRREVGHYDWDKSSYC